MNKHKIISEELYNSQSHKIQPNKIINNKLKITIIISGLVIIFCLFKIKSSPSRSLKNSSTLSNRKLNSNLAVVILSARENEARRKVIRKTWGSYFENTFFAVGKDFCEYPVEDRKNWYQCTSAGRRTVNNKTQGDLYLSQQASLQGRLLLEDKILLTDCIDTYWNLTKKVLKSYSVLLKEIPDLKWAMKADDDAFVRTNKIEELVKKLDYKTPTVIGKTQWEI